MQRQRLGCCRDCRSDRVLGDEPHVAARLARKTSPAPFHNLRPKACGRLGVCSGVVLLAQFHSELLMSALPPKADIGTQPRDVRFVPKADINSVWNLRAPARYKRPKDAG